MLSLHRPGDFLRALANFVRTNRLSQNLTREALSRQSGVGVTTLARIESTGVCSTENLAKVLVALGSVDLLMEALTPPAPASIAELRSAAQAPARKRARGTSQ